jgi:hypothetical protein
MFNSFNKVVHKLDDLVFQVNRIACTMWFEFVFLVIFSELIVQCVIRFGRFVRMLEYQWKC